MDGKMDYNWLGVCGVSEDLSVKMHRQIQDKMQELLDNAIEEFNDFLDANDLEQTMGIIKSKDEIQQPKAPLLTDKEIECFNSYIEDAKVDIAFGNSDWCEIYHKIVGDKASDYAKNRIMSYRQRLEE